MTFEKGATSSLADGEDRARRWGESRLAINAARPTSITCGGASFAPRAVLSILEPMTPHATRLLRANHLGGLQPKLCAEFIGTFALVFIGAGAVIMESHTGMSHLKIPDGKVGLVGIALAHGLTLAAMIAALGSHSGGHFNPAVSFAMWLRGKLRTELFLGYTLAQIAGAAVAGMLLAGLFPDEIALASLGTPTLAAKISPLKGGLIEAIITFLLVTTVLFAARRDDAPGAAALAIGGALAAVILFAGPLTGGSANPARYLGPALAAGRLGDLLSYVLGPLIGAAGATAVSWFVNSEWRDKVMVPPVPEVIPVPASGSPALEIARADVGPPVSSHSEQLETARVQLERGNWKEAAQALLPILWQFDQCERDVRNRVRSLLLVIEDETGKLDFLDRYRDLVFGNSR